MAAIKGGHTYFMQNQTKRINAMAWPRIVAFMFTAQYLFNICGLGF
jgi:hypothetical protein